MSNQQERNKTQVIVAVVAATAAIIAAIIGLGQPIVEKWAEARFPVATAPTDASTLNSTNTPKSPTNIPRSPTATPDPTVRDSFDDPVFEGTFNNNMWRIDCDAESSQFVQRDGVLIVTQEGTLNTCTRLSPGKYDSVLLNGPTIFEAKMKIEPTKNAGWVVLFIDFDFLEAKGLASCRINQDAIAFCEYVDDTSSNWDSRYETEYRSIGDSQLHTFRIEVDPAIMSFTYYLDGQFFGSYTPPDADKFEGKASFIPTIGVTNWEWNSTAAIAGYFDDVRIGPVGQ